MKNLLFSLNLLPLVWMFGSCGENPVSSDQSENIEASSASTSSSPDTMNPHAGSMDLPCDTVVPSPASTISQPPVDTDKKPPRTNPRNTQGPDQDIVDSLKQVKTKGKKGD